MIGMAGLLFPNDGTHEQQLAGHSGLDCVFYCVFSFYLLCYFISSLQFRLTDVNTLFVFIGMYFFFFPIWMSCHFFHSDVLHSI